MTHMLGTCDTCKHGEFKSKSQVGMKGICREKKLFVTKSSGNQCKLWAEKPTPKKNLVIAVDPANGADHTGMVECAITDGKLIIVDETPPLVSKQIAEHIVKPAQFSLNLQKSKD